MPKSRVRKPTPEAIRQRQYKGLHKRWWTPVRRISAAIAGAIAFAAAGVTFLPRITVEASGPFEASAPPPVTFTIANVGIVPLEEVKPRLGFCALGINFGLKDDNPVPPFKKCNGTSSGFLAPANWQHSRLDMDEKFTVTWDDAFHNQTPGQVDFADVILTVAYQPWVLPWHREKTFRFVTRKLPDQKLYWFPRPLAD